MSREHCVYWFKMDSLLIETGERELVNVGIPFAFRSGFPFRTEIAIKRAQSHQQTRQKITGYLSEHSITKQIDRSINCMRLFSFSFLFTWKQQQQASPSRLSEMKKSKAESEKEKEREHPPEKERRKYPAPLPKESRHSNPAHISSSSSAAKEESDNKTRHVGGGGGGVPHRTKNHHGTSSVVPGIISPLLKDVRLIKTFNSINVELKNSFYWVN